MVGLFYHGDQVSCPICNHSYKTFLSYGRINPRPNALCPHCLSLERHRLIWLYLQADTNFFNYPQHVLHIAPEACFLKRFELIHKENYFTADLESPLAKVKMDIHEIPFPENSFDVILCNHVLEHVNDDIKAMMEINRVLKPGGYALMQIPFFSPVPDTTFEDNSIKDPREREKIFGQSDHVRKYGRDYGKRIEHSGLIAEENTFGKSLSEEQAIRFGVQPNEVIFIGRKGK